MADSVEELKKTQKLYLLIGAVLFIFTVVTVAVATIPWLDFGGHGFDATDMVIGLLIATFKASLVGAIFMHLNHEKKAIYYIFGLGIVLGVALMVLTAFAYSDPIHYGDPGKGDGFYNPAIPEIRD
jgi:caa(3)-type oxidase subunit IV